MITLYTFGPFLGTPDSSPFVIKAMVLLKLAGLDYREESGGLFRAPEGLLPFIDDEGEKIADSTFIRFHLERKYHLDFDAGLGDADRAIAWSLEKLVEDHLYFALLDLRWTNRANFARGIAKMFEVLPSPIRPLARRLMRRRTIARTRGHGMGRHSRQQIERLAVKDLETLATILGDRSFLMGDRPCAADAAVFGFVAALLTPDLDSPIIDAVRSHANLVAYRDRLMERWFTRVRCADKTHRVSSLEDVQRAERLSGPR